MKKILWFQFSNGCSIYSVENTEKCVGWEVVYDEKDPIFVEAGENAFSEIDKIITGRG